jgi:tetratricopeptide (TPR) repeat protein
VRQDLERVNLELDLARGRFEAGRPWLEGADPIPEECYARSRKERAGGDRLIADLFEARAHLLWARQHAALGNFDDAVRSYRQCVRVTRDHVDGGASSVRLELAAALSAAGRKDEARTELDAIRRDPPDRDGLPAWVGDALRGLE